MKNKEQKPEENEINMDLPEVSDIPGQENIKPPKIREMMDTTASSAGEEGEGILDDPGSEDQLLDDRSNVSDEEKKLLEETDHPPTEEDRDLEKLALDNVDEDEEGLNESGGPLDMGEDLDIPGSELDDEDEEMGEEDEENNSYSQRD